MYAKIGMKSSFQFVAEYVELHSFIFIIMHSLVNQVSSLWSHVLYRVEFLHKVMGGLFGAQILHIHHESV